ELGLSWLAVAVEPIGSVVSPLTAPTKRPRKRNRERLAGGAGGGNEHPCSPARGGRNRRPGWLPQPSDCSPPVPRPQCRCILFYGPPLEYPDRSLAAAGLRRGVEAYTWNPLSRPPPAAASLSLPSTRPPGQPVRLPRAFRIQLIHHEHVLIAL